MLVLSVGEEEGQEIRFYALHHVVVVRLDPGDQGALVVGSGEGVLPNHCKDGVDGLVGADDDSF